MPPNPDAGTEIAAGHPKSSKRVRAALAGCAHRAPPVQPWQREHLAKRGMRLDMPDELAEDRFRQHWLGAREGSDLGYGEPGGGCGCN